MGSSSLIFETSLNKESSS